MHILRPATNFFSSNPVLSIAAYSALFIYVHLAILSVLQSGNYAFSSSWSSNHGQNYSPENSPTVVASYTLKNDSNGGFEWIQNDMASDHKRYEIAGSGLSRPRPNSNFFLRSLFSILQSDQEKTAQQPTETHENYIENSSSPTLDEHALAFHALQVIHPSSVDAMTFLCQIYSNICLKSRKTGRCLAETYPGYLSPNQSMTVIALLFVPDLPKAEISLVLPGLQRVDTVYSSTLQWARKAAPRVLTTISHLIKASSRTDVLIMSVSYLSVFAILFSLLSNMRQLGSRFSLATAVLIQSWSALCLACYTAHKLGVTINLLLLCEALPFFMVTVGFEKPILLTKAVLLRSPSTSKDPISKDISVAVTERGPGILKIYATEFAIVVLGVLSGVDGLKQFSFIAALVLIYDCMFLFTFYISVLTIKLEVQRLDRHLYIRRALQEEGISYEAAEQSALASDPRGPTDKISENFVASDGRFSIFGKKHMRVTNFTRFKLILVSSLVLLIFLDWCSLPLAGWRTSNVSSSIGESQFDLTGFLSKMTADSIIDFNTYSTTKIDVEAPLLFVRYSQTSLYHNILALNAKISNFIARPSIARCIFVALFFSLAINTYLFNAATKSALVESDHLSVGSLSETSTIDISLQDRASSTRENTPDLISDTKNFNEALSDTKETSMRHLSDRNGAADVGLSSSMMANGTGSVKRVTRITSSENHHSKAVNGKPSKQEKLQVKRSPQKCLEMVKLGEGSRLLDEELIDLVIEKKIPLYSIEKVVSNDFLRATIIRRSAVSRMSFSQTLESSDCPVYHYDFSQVYNACCENVIGYIPIPLGIAGPLTIDGISTFIPLATTEGALVASTMRGCKAINSGGGVTTFLTSDSMTRGPCVSFPTLKHAKEAKEWADSEAGQSILRNAFNSTSRFARLRNIRATLAGSMMFIRFASITGDAMGMNMISKGVENALSIMMGEFPEMKVVSVSGNYCTDKKPAALNWIEGRGKSVVAEAIIPVDVVRSVLKAEVSELIELNTCKNLVGSAMAGSVGGFNAHAANIVTAVYLATGQDPAQNVESSNCLTYMKSHNGNLSISVTMPCIEVGTIGGGTVLKPQGAMLDLLGVRGPHPTKPGANAQRLACIVAAATLAGELSLCAALASGHLVKSHMQHNRSQAPSRRDSMVNLAQASQRP